MPSNLMRDMRAAYYRLSPQRRVGMTIEELATLAGHSYWH